MAPKERGGRGEQARRGVYLILTALTEHTFIWVNEGAGQVPLPRKCISWQKAIWGSQVGSPGSAWPQKRLGSRMGIQSLAAEIRAFPQFTFFPFSLTFHALVGNPWSPQTPSV